MSDTETRRAELLLSQEETDVEQTRSKLKTLQIILLYLLRCTHDLFHVVDREGLEFRL